MSDQITAYNESQSGEDRAVCQLLYVLIQQGLSDANGKIWHGHPVWFIDDNPIVGYSIQKKGVRLMFWSGMSFDEKQLQPGTGKFKDASVFYTHPDQVHQEDVDRWLEKARTIQWDYKNVVKRKGKLIRLQ